MLEVKSLWLSKSKTVTIGGVVIIYLHLWMLMLLSNATISLIMEFKNTEVNSSEISKMKQKKHSWIFHLQRNRYQNLNNNLKDLIIMTNNNNNLSNLSKHNLNLICKYIMMQVVVVDAFMETAWLKWLILVSKWLNRLRKEISF